MTTTERVDDENEAAEETAESELSSRAVIGGGVPQSAQDAFEDELAHRRRDRSGEVLASRYRLLERIGMGGTGSVYLGVHRAIQKRVAVKLLDGPNAGQSDFAARFLQEAQAASRLRHQNIVDVTDFGETDDGSVFLVMEYLDGEDLASTLDREHRLPWVRARHVVLQVLSALDCAHRGSFIHRDIKLENCFRTEHFGDPDFIKVLDFGNAKRIDDGRARQHARHWEQLRAPTADGVIIGTAAYISPEQAQQLPLDQRSDLYSVGVMLFEILTGQLPFDDPSFMGLLTKHIHEWPPSPREVAPDVDISPQLESLILKLLAKTPEDRYESAAAVIKAMRAIPVESAGGARSGGSVHLASRPRGMAEPPTTGARSTLVGTSPLSEPGPERRHKATAAFDPRFAGESLPTGDTEGQPADTSNTPDPAPASRNQHGTFVVRTGDGDPFAARIRETEHPPGTREYADDADRAPGAASVEFDLRSGAAADGLRPRAKASRVRAATPVGHAPVLGPEDATARTGPPSVPEYAGVPSGQPDDTPTTFELAADSNRDGARAPSTHPASHPGAQGDLHDEDHEQDQRQHQHQHEALDSLNTEAQSARLASESAGSMAATALPSAADVPTDEQLRELLTSTTEAASSDAQIVPPPPRVGPFTLRGAGLSDAAPARSRTTNAPDEAAQGESSEEFSDGHLAPVAASLQANTLPADQGDPGAPAASAWPGSGDWPLDEPTKTKAVAMPSSPLKMGSEVAELQSRTSAGDHQAPSEAENTGESSIALDDDLLLESSTHRPGMKWLMAVTAGAAAVALALALATSSDSDGSTSLESVADSSDQLKATPAHPSAKPSRLAGITAGQESHSATTRDPKQATAAGDRPPNPPKPEMDSPDSPTAEPGARPSGSSTRKGTGSSRDTSTANVGGRKNQRRRNTKDRGAQADEKSAREKPTSGPSKQRKRGESKENKVAIPETPVIDDAMARANAVRAIKRAAQNCGRSKGAFPGDRVRIDFAVRSGKPKNIEIVGSRGSAALESCIAGSVARQTFPGPDEAMSFSVEM